jgi:release factor glutamine methyltransferase
MNTTVCREKDLFKSIAWAGELLATAGVPNPKVDAEILAASILQADRMGLYLNPEPLRAEDWERFFELVQRRCRREPLQYILGEAPFYGRSFYVNDDVLIPRPETELLVEQVLNRVERPGRILDIGTGSGCIAVTLACELPEAEVLAIDSEWSALSIARENASRHYVGDRVRAVCGDLMTAIREDCRTDVVAANLPYIPVPELKTLQEEVRDFEPWMALCGGEDGLTLIRRLILNLPNVLRPMGLLALEIGEGQEKTVCSMIEGTGSFENVEVVADLAGRNRMVFAVKQAKQFT